MKAGQPVRQDEVLFKLDDADLQTRLKQSQAAADAATGRKQQAEADYERSAKLVEKKAVSPLHHDQAIATMKTATSDLERAQQAVQEANVLLEYATIRSPMSGLVVDKRVESGDTVTPGQVLLTLYEPAEPAFSSSSKATYPT